MLAAAGSDLKDIAVKKGRETKRLRLSWKRHGDGDERLCKHEKLPQNIVQRGEDQLSPDEDKTSRACVMSACVLQKCSEYAECLATQGPVHAGEVRWGIHSPPLTPGCLFPSFLRLHLAPLFLHTYTQKKRK